MSSVGMKLNFEYGKPFFNKSGKLCINIYICDEAFTYLLNGYTTEGIPILGQEIING